MTWRHLVLFALLFLPQSGDAQPQTLSAQIQTQVVAMDGGDATRRFYELRNNAPAWTGSPAARSDAKLALTILAKAAEEGLDPDRYGVFVGSWSPAADDIALSSAVLRYMSDLAVGRSELQDIDPDMGLPARTLDAPELLQAALVEGELGRMLRTLVPKHPEYARLKAELAAAPADALVANMERWRWVPAYLEPDRIMVNTAAADLQMWLGGKLSHPARGGRGNNREPALDRATFHRRQGDTAQTESQPNISAKARHGSAERTGGRPLWSEGELACHTQGHISLSHPPATRTAQSSGPDQGRAAEPL